MSLTSTAKIFKVWYKTGGSYELLEGAVVDNITLNDFNVPSVASFTMLTARAGDEQLIGHGDLVKITSSDGIIFMGMITNNPQGASGSSGGGSSFERVGFKASDYRYILDRTNVIHGVYGHGYSDYDFSAFDPADSNSVVLAQDTYTYFSGIRAVFNPEGRGNRTNSPLNVAWRPGGTAEDIYIHVEPGYGSRWTAKQMIKYLLFIGWNNFKDYFDVDSPADFEGLDNAKFDETPWHVAVEGLTLTDAIYAICKEVGMRFREVYTAGEFGEPRWQFYEPRYIASGDCVFHNLYCPAVGKQIDGTKTKRTWAFDVETDSTKQVNYAIAIGGPQRYEITAQLVPAFADPVFSSAPVPPFMSEEEIAASVNPNANEIFAKYDSRGSSFMPNIFRLWTLNELGLYSFNPYNRDIPQDLYDLIGADARDGGLARFGLHRRPLLPALTQLGLTSDSSGIKVEFSFDGGTSWGPLPCNIINLDQEGGIWIAEPNLHNIKPSGGQTITGGALDGVEGSFLTSILSDILAAHVFRLDASRLPSGKSNWLTRIRVTACIELEQRPIMTANGGLSPVYRELYDFSDRYRYWKRAASSVLTGTTDEHDDSSQLQYQADTILEQNGHIRAAGTFTIDQIDFAFAPGDIIGGITGRGIVLGSENAITHYATGAEIIQIIHEPMAQTTRIITADDRFTE